MNFENSENSENGLASSPPQNFKFQRPDWALFRTIEGLQQRAGVPKELLRRLVLKELADNGLDNGAAVQVGNLPGGGYFIEDGGSGIDPEYVATLFSIARPMVSTKLWRLPTRGALGNGLRVVAGAVLASEGSLIILTRDRRIELRPERDGTTTVVNLTPVEFPIGTRVEISLGPSLPDDTHPFAWASRAIRMSQFGQSYTGKSSPSWYDAPTFHELLYAGGATPVRELIANFDGCTGAKAGEIVAQAGIVGRKACKDVDRDQAQRLLLVAQSNARQVKPARLGAVGPDVYGDWSYGCATGFALVAPNTLVPFVVEAWAEEYSHGETILLGNVNRTPITGSLVAARDRRDIDAHGCGLHHTIAIAPKDKNFYIQFNVITPFMPITSDGKAPNLKVFLEPIAKAISSAVRKAHVPDAKGNQKSVVLKNLDEAIAKASGDGRYRFNSRQLLYVLRPMVKAAMDAELKVANFTGIITDYEFENGEIPGMYREPRGSIYHPHIEETITLGTLMVEGYERPEWNFNKVVYIEKEGFSEALKEVRWAERHDCMLMSSKGFSSRAARDLVDKLAEHDEPVTIFCVHDADAYGTIIYQTFQEATKARDARKITIVNLGLEPDEAQAMELEVEEIGKPDNDRTRPVADYAREWEGWLQTKRVELNAMTTPQFVAWLDSKMMPYDGKLIPPAKILEAELAKRIEAKVREAVTERILKKAGAERQIKESIAAIDKPDAKILELEMKRLFAYQQDKDWRSHIETAANKATKS